MSPTPVIIERFRIERVLAHGGMAVVYLAEDERGEQVALKQLASHLADDSALRQRFRREARIAASLVHPSIVRVVAVGAGDVPYLAMELVAGGTVHGLACAEGRLDVERALEIGAQCASGLAYAHARGVVHRDIKPQNLLLTLDGRVKIADFGIARLIDATQMTQPGSVLGTVRYLAPEQAMGERAGPGADVYALGVVLYELLAGRTPFEGASAHELVLRQRSEAPPSLCGLRPDIPPHVERIVLECLRVDAERRPSAAALARRLGGAGDAATIREPGTAPAPTIVLPPPSTIAGPRRTARVPGRRARAALFALATAVVVAIALLVSTSGDGGGAPPATRAAPIPRAATPAAQARAIAAWLRQQSAR